MNSPETQPESQSDSSMTYFDPEQVDTSEQEFAVSLEQPAELPAFEIEPEKNFVPKDRAKSLVGQRGTGDPIVPSQLTVEAEKDAGIVSPAPSELSEKQAVPDSGPDWRNLVSAKVNSYRSRRPRKERYPSLQLQFEPEPQRPRLTQEDLSTFDVPAVVECAHPAEVPAMRSATPILLESTARVLEFPRSVATPIRTDELADPVVDRPRILEAPELLPPPPAMGGILIGPPAVPPVERRPGFEVPLQSAALNRRVAAALADTAVVAGASALFAYIVWRIVGTIPPWRSGAVFLGGMFAVLWAAYQYAFLVFCGKTPGLLMTRLEIRKFDGTLVSRSLRRWRALASILSLASVCLGYAWCFFDEDQLSWHDRITHTHLAPRSAVR